MLAAIDDDTRLVFVANPNNPTGTFIDGPTLEAFIAKVPRHVAIVLDEAYTEYLSPENRYDSIDWVRRYPNLLVSRTFSKAFGLAGLARRLCDRAAGTDRPAEPRCVSRST